MKISAIVATDENGLIGLDNDIPWYLSDDLKLFKKHTINHHIIMGRKTFESIGRPLPKRTNVILTRDPMYLASGCIIAHSLKEALQLAHNNGEEEAFIIGGADIFEMALPVLDHLLLSTVHTEIDVPADKEGVYFPQWPIESVDWEVTEVKVYKADERNDFDFTFRALVRKSDH